MQKQHQVLYTADIHGNELQYAKLIELAVNVNADSIIIGGDIAPKGESSTTAHMEKLKTQGISIDAFIDMQRCFLKERLPELVRPLKDKLPNAKLFLMMGNDDCSCNLDVLMKHDGDLYFVVHERRFRLNDDFDIVGYSYVPITPFGIKDWEKFDMSLVPQELQKEYSKRKQTNYRLAGLFSSDFGWTPFQFSSAMETKDSIQKDLSEESFRKNSVKTVYVIHTPPNNTNLDQLVGKRHVGSFAVRQFIEQAQPYLTLHGHIHETVDVSGSFKDVIKNSVCLSPGNYPESQYLKVLSFNLYDLRTVQRLIV